jgi:hypothetical protein
LLRRRLSSWADEGDINTPDASESELTTPSP